MILRGWLYVESDSKRAAHTPAPLPFIPTFNPSPPGALVAWNITCANRIPFWRCEHTRVTFCVAFPPGHQAGKTTRFSFKFSVTLRKLQSVGVPDNFFPKTEGRFQPTGFRSSTACPLLVNVNPPLSCQIKACNGKSLGSRTYVSVRSN